MFFVHFLQNHQLFEYMTTAIFLVIIFLNQNYSSLSRNPKQIIACSKLTPNYDSDHCLSYSTFSVSAAFRAKADRPSTYFDKLIMNFGTTGGILSHSCL